MDEQMILVRKGHGRGIMLMEPALFKFHEYVLVLAHARSYTTLLCHILGSHPQICGYSEAMIPYETAVDLIRLNTEVFKAKNYRGDSRYVLDKNLYDAFPVSDAVLGLGRVTPLFLVREPAPAITSHARMRISEHEQGISDWGPEGADRAANIELAAVYYAERLTSLQSMCGRLEAMGKRAIFLTADDLLDRTAAAFRLMERELGLDGPLREEYRLFPNTGQPGSGDTSEVILSGRIVRERDEPEPMPIPPHRLDAARRAYDECLSAFRASPVMTRV
jgi:hypothetical protein